MGIQQMMLSTRSLAATAAPAIFTVVAATTTIDTGNCTVTVTGAIGSVSYSWVKVSGDNIICVQPTLGTTIFRATGMAVNETRQAIYECVVSDSTGSTTTNNVSITLTRN